MLSQMDTRRQIFRADIRRESIELYQQKIRIEHLNRQERAISESFMDVDPLSQLIEKLTSILLMWSYESSTVDNFELLLHAITISTKTQNQQITMENLTKKEKIIALVYSITDRALDNDNYQICSIIDQILHLLQFPALMPLWQKLSLTANSEIKVYSMGKFAFVLKQSMFDNDFIMDVISNFITQPPLLHFHEVECLLPYLPQHKSIAKLNQLTMILRTMIREKQIVHALINSQYNQLIMQIICSLTLPTKTKCQQHETPFELSFKNNVIKLITQLFVCDYEGSLQLFLMYPNVMFLLLQFLLAKNCQMKEESKFIVCRSHGILIKNSLVAIQRMIDVGSSPILIQFLNQSGLDYFHQLLSIIEMRANEEYCFNSTEREWKAFILRILYIIQQSNIQLNFNNCEKYFQILERFLNIFNINQQEQLMFQVLNLMKLFLIQSYARSYEIFQQLSSNVMYSVCLRSLLEWIGQLGGRISYVARQVLDIPHQPQLYLH